MSDNYAWHPWHSSQRRDAPVEHCVHLVFGQPADYIAHDVAGIDLRVCPGCYVFVNRARQDIYDYMRLHGIRSHA